MRIEEAVCSAYEISADELTSTCREKGLVEARSVACLFMTYALGWGSPRIARSLGYSDHTTVLSLRRRVACRLVEDSMFLARAQRVENLLGLSGVVDAACEMAQRKPRVTPAKRVEKSGANGENLRYTKQKKIPPHPPKENINPGSTPVVPFEPEPSPKPSPRPSPIRQRPAKPLPEDWAPTESHRDFAARHALDLDREAWAFRQHHAGATARSWNGRFATWLNNQVTWQRQREARAPPSGVQPANGVSDGFQRARSANAKT